MPLEMDQPLNFHGDSEISRQPSPHPQGVDSNVLDVAEQNSEGSVSLMSWGKSSAKLLHHKKHYCPTVTLTPEQYKRAKKKGV